MMSYHRVGSEATVNTSAEAVQSLCVQGIAFSFKNLFGKSVNHSGDPGSFHNFKIWIRPIFVF